MTLCGQLLNELNTSCSSGVSMVTALSKDFSFPFSALFCLFFVCLFFDSHTNRGQKQQNRMQNLHRLVPTEAGPNGKPMTPTRTKWKHH